LGTRVDLEGVQHSSVGSSGQPPSFRSTSTVPPWSFRAEGVDEPAEVRGGRIVGGGCIYLRPRATEDRHWCES
jgi:hypothetical protein